ncbi:MAG: hypothetical protein H0T60_03975 [Acidobacteria bacterium]|nr:hypothetical protein [Acidobacteriota bacterium]
MRKDLSSIVSAARASFVVAFAFVACVSYAQAQTGVQNPERPRRAQPSPSAATSSVRVPEQTPQDARPSATPAARTDGGAEEAAADLSITARVTARELRFEKVPNPTVEFTGRPERETVWEAERENLPAQVRPGETYRDIGIKLRITSVFADIERIVAEALGEVPLSDDAPDAPSRPASSPQLAPRTSAAPQISPAPPSITNSTTPPRRRPTRGGRVQ